MGSGFMDFKDRRNPRPQPEPQQVKTPESKKSTAVLSSEPEQTVRPNTATWEDLFKRAEYVVNKTYLAKLNAHDCNDLSDTKGQPVTAHTRFFKIDHIVYNKDENTLQKLTNLYAAAHSIGLNPALLLHSDGDTVELYLGVHNVNNDVSSALNALYSNFQGNFPGSMTGECQEHCVMDTDLEAKLDEWIGGKNSGNDAVAVVSGVPASRWKQEQDNRKYVQGLERVVDTMQGTSYTILILAQNVSPSYLHHIQTEYENIYSVLSPNAKQIYTYSENQSRSIGQTISTTLSQTTSITESATLSLGRSYTQGESESTSTTVGANLGGNAGVGILGLISGGIWGSVNLSRGHTHGKSTSESSSWMKSDSTSASNSEGRSETKGTTDTVGSGVSEGYQIEFHNKTVEQMLERIDRQLDRIQQGQCYGMFGVAAYFISSNNNLVNTAASAYKAIISGQNSADEMAAINTWSKKDNQKNFARICSALRNMQHPVFQIDQNNAVTPASLVNGYELAIAMGLPSKSLSGVTVLHMAPFGRNVPTAQDGNTLALGELTYLGKPQGKPVCLDLKQLTAHTFITGSTGAGKSNVIYTLLDRLCLQRDAGVKFLVIEPAKGEYKEALGGYPEVQVYGTNPQKTPLLRLNPFSFPEDTHALEHIDRLVEICNACWPMYAAMPAVLKAAVERAYKDCGWSLQSSTCAGKRVFPTFRDVMRALPAVVDSKGFSNDTQGDYKGALLTRLESLTNGINGQVLCSYDELTDEELFDRNVIVDISRVGSSETKALLMGVLILKLQEYRMAQRSGSAGKANDGLRHITVLEEAHNLLRRTSTEQSQESSNLQGKSVEMLTNAIAEMRTYGEGFVIADQAPGLLDMAVIRNTNTKIILRLPDESDRLLVGKAAGLNDEQIVELSRLDTGVAAVYQNQWLEPVLCKVSHFDSAKKFSYRGQPSGASPDLLEDRIFKALVKNTRDGVLLEREGVDRIKTWIDRQETGREIKKLLWQVLIDRKPLSEHDKEYTLYCLTQGKHIIEEARRTAIAPEDAGKALDAQIMEAFQISEQRAQEVRRVILQYAADHIREKDEKQYHELRRIGGVQ